MTFYITRKDLMDEGIVETEIGQVDELKPKHLYIAKGYSFLVQPEWHHTREEAVQHCNRVRDREIKLLKDRIKFLEEKVF